MAWPANNKYATVRAWLIQLLTDLPDERERDNIARELMTFRTRKSRAQLMIEPHPFTESDLNFFVASAERLVKHVPLQHITNQAFFFGRPFYIDGRVLVPRPETEELVELALSEFHASENIRVLDIGTGSGVIPISIKLERPLWEVHAWEISKEAIDVASQNAQDLSADIAIAEVDVLSNDLPKGTFDLIISNPPYIPESERAIMDQRVTDHDPSLALFVEDTEPLIFYQRIAGYAEKHLTASGKLLFEIHEEFGKEMQELLASKFRTELYQDAQGKDRILKAERK
ncbi:peptide chain release factor N(5)-glutamine methyltransferase [Sanyastnella coralliicola]|uniref:peptide chain release factor N(5)-glutamine methyltransferase n=1 Tax=Sanyastnella coralliicola TaxID=3069118 RepID=UPI0027B95C43|nr:peptide chain release factor N(5)-glutamine methyltransferase [Longitalea sp. SCSIO 12813]